MKRKQVCPISSSESNQCLMLSDYYLHIRSINDLANRRTIYLFPIIRSKRIKAIGNIQKGNTRIYILKINLSSFRRSDYTYIKHFKKAITLKEKYLKNKNC